MMRARQQHTRKADVTISEFRHSYPIFNGITRGNDESFFALKKRSGILPKVLRFALELCDLKFA